MKKLTEWKENKREMLGNIKQAWKNFWAEEDGMGSVEIILILVILVGIVCIFQPKI